MKDEQKPGAVSWKKNDELELVIEDMGTQGEGIGHADGYTLFVRGALPGEKVRVRLLKCNKSYGFAKLMEVLEPSPYRVLPVCPEAQRCGGCTLQHMAYEGQLHYKEKKVRDCLERIGGVDPAAVEWLPILGMEGEPWHFRNKAQFPVRADEEGKAVAGFFAGHSHRLIPVSRCAIQHPVINDTLEATVSFLRRHNIAPYDETCHRGLVRHIYVRRAYHTAEVMVCLVINGTSLPHADEFVRDMRRIPGMTGICLNVNREKTNVVMGPEISVLWGSEYICDTIGGISFRISPLSFYQVNPVQTEKLYETARSFAGLQGHETVFDLYCGIGTISLFMAHKLRPDVGGKVIGIEVVPQAIENAGENASLNHMSHAQFFCGAAEETLPALLRDRILSGYADIVVLDPPRKGCDPVLLHAVASVHPDKIVYVSCDPATLARDVKVLGTLGYEVRKVQACDMFPQGGHVETVVLMSRKDK